MANLLNERIAPNINSAISKNTFKNNIAKFFGSFLNKNRDKFSDIGPMSNIYFPKEYHTDLFNMFNVDENTVAQCMKDSKDIYVITDREQTVKPYNLMLAVAIKCLHDKKMDTERAMVMFLLYMSFFGSTYSKYFKYNPNRSIMEYTINSMSKKYNIKTKGWYVALQDSAEGVYKNIAPKLSKADDSTYQYMVTDTKTRLNSLLNNIFGEFKKNHEQGNFLNFEGDSLDEDDFHLAESDSLKIRNIRNAVTINICSDSPNIKLLQYACKLCNVSVNETRNILYTIQKSEKMRKHIEIITEGIITNYVIDKKQKISNIHSNDFLVNSIMFFKKSSGVQKNISTVKKSLDELLDYGLHIKVNTSTISSFKRAIYIYIVLTIQQSI